MRFPCLPQPHSRRDAVVALLLSLGLAACGGGTERAQAGTNAAATADAGEADEAGPQPPDVNPCALLTAQEISEQLLFTIPAYNRRRLAADSFEVTPAEVPWGVSRRCEFTWRTKAPAGETPMARGLFHVMVFPEGMAGVGGGDRRPVPGAGPEIFQHQRVYYVSKGTLAASLTDFGGTQESGRDENAGRVALLQAIASRLP